MNKRIVIVLIMLTLWQQAALAQKKHTTSGQKKHTATGQKKHTTTGQRKQPASVQKNQVVPVQQKQAARDTIHTNTIEVIQSYRPEVAQAPKPEFDAGLPPVDTSTVRLQYDVPAQTLQFTYRSQPLKPLALGRDTSVPPFANYVKLGGGNLSTLYFDAGIGSLHGERYETAIQLHHLSQQGNIKYQKSMLSGIDAAGTLHTERHAWTAGISALRNQFYHYGYDHAALPGYVPPAQVLAGARLQVGMRNELGNSAGIDYNPGITASVFTGSQIEQEQQYTINVPCSKVIDSMLTAHLGIAGSYTRLSAGAAEGDAGMFAIRPGLGVRSGIFSGHIILSPTFGNGGNAYLLPDILASLRVRDSRFLVQGGWSALLQQNTYEQFFLRNPFIGTGNSVPGLLSQRRTDEVYAGVQSNIGNHIAVSGRVSWWAFRNMPLWLNDPADRSQFDLIYDPQIDAVSLQANARYQVGNTFALGLGGTWFNYYRSTVTHVWHEPGVQFKADFLFRPLPALVITGYGLLLDQIYATDATGKAVRLRAVLDIGGGAEYTFIPRLSAFAQVNNLLNNRYQRWQGYPSYGFNIFGGLRLKF